MVCFSGFGFARNDGEIKEKKKAFSGGEVAAKRHFLSHAAGHRRLLKLLQVNHLGMLNK